MSGLFSHILAYCGMFWRPPNKNPIESITSKISQKCNFGVCCTRIALSQNKDIKKKSKFLESFSKYWEKSFGGAFNRGMFYFQNLLYLFTLPAVETLFFAHFFLLSRARCQCVTKIDFSIDRGKKSLKNKESFYGP